MSDDIDRDRVMGSNLIISQLKQFKKLESLGLDDDEMAHRMAMEPREVNKVRYLIGSGRVRLAKLSIPYHSRVLLGTAKIKTIGGLLAKTDAELLKIKKLGPKTLIKIKEAICDYMEAGL